MEDYNKIIESLGVRFIKAKQINVVQPIAIDNFYDVENRAILVNKGAVGYGEPGKEKYARKGEVLFVPGGKSARLIYGEKPEVNLTNDEFISRKELYVQAHTDTKGESIANYSYIGFEAKVFNSVNTYFKDPRLIDIFNYIKENLSGNLSNKVLAGVANVSEDYVGWKKP